MYDQNNLYTDPNDIHLMIDAMGAGELRPEHQPFIDMIQKSAGSCTNTPQNPLILKLSGTYRIIPIEKPHQISDESEELDDF